MEQRERRPGAGWSLQGEPEVEEGGLTETGENPLWSLLIRVPAHIGMRAGNTWDPLFQRTPWTAQRPAEERVWGEVPGRPEKRVWRASIPGHGDPSPSFLYPLEDWACKCLPLTTRAPGARQAGRGCRGMTSFPGLLNAGSREKRGDPCLEVTRAGRPEAPMGCPLPLPKPPEPGKLAEVGAP